MTAVEVYREYLSKAAGDRGGQVVGLTASGKPVYAEARANSSVYRAFQPRDHASAANYHQRLADSAEEGSKTRAHHSEMAREHRTAYSRVVASQQRGQVRNYAAA